MPIFASMNPANLWPKGQVSGYCFIVTWGQTPCEPKTYQSMENILNLRDGSLDHENRPAIFYSTVKVVIFSEFFLLSLLGSPMRIPYSPGSRSSS